MVHLPSLPDFCPALSHPSPFTCQPPPPQPPPGTWKGKPVAVKIVTHASLEEPRISRELALTLPLEHPHLVRTLHFARMSIRPSPNATPVSGCAAGG